MKRRINTGLVVTLVLVLQIFVACSSHVIVSGPPKVPPGQAKKGQLPPGHAKKAAGNQSAKAHAPGQKKKK